MPLLVVSAFGAKSFHPPAEGELLLFMLVQKRSNQEKTTPPLTRLAGILPARSAGGLRGLSTGPPALTPNWPASMPATLRVVPPPTRRFRGAPGRATRILRVLFRRARATARATLRFGFSPSTRRMRVALPGAPLKRRAGGGKARRVAGMDAGQFGVRAGCSVDKPRNPPADFPGRKPGKRVSGVSFPLGYFSFGQANEK